MTRSKVSVFTNIRYTINPPHTYQKIMFISSRRRGKPAIFRVKFRRNHRTNTSSPLSRWERVAKIRGGKFANFSQTAASSEMRFSQLRKRHPTRRAPCGCTKFRKRDPEYAEKKPWTNRSSTASEARWNFLFCFNFLTILSNRTNDQYFKWWKTCPWRPADRENSR